MQAEKPITVAEAGWRDRMERLIEELAGRCRDCFRKGYACQMCFCAESASIIRDRDAEAAGAVKLPDYERVRARRLEALKLIAQSDWCRPSDIKVDGWENANARCYDLKQLIEWGCVERKPVDPGNTRAFLYRATGRAMP